LIVKFTLPLISQDMPLYEIQTIYFKENKLIQKGSRLIDFKAQLTNHFAHDCPSINFYRIVSQESFWIRKILITQHEHANPNYLAAILSTSQDETIEDIDTTTKELRITYAGIAHEVDWFGLG